MARTDEHQRARTIGSGLILSAVLLAVGTGVPFAQDQDGPPPELLLSNAQQLFITADDKRQQGGDPTNDYRAAIGYYFQYMDAKPDLAESDTVLVYNRLARAYKGIAEAGTVENVAAYWDTSKTYFQWLIDRNPESEYLAGNYLFAGYATYMTEGMAAAAPYWEDYVELQPNDLAQREYLISMLVSLQQYPKAIDHALAYLEQDASNDGIVDNLLALRDRIDMRWLEITTALVERRPDTPKYLLDMGQYYYERVQNEQAADFLGRYTQAAPDDITGWMVLGDTYKRMGRYGEALQAFDHILSLDSNDIRAHTDKAAVYLEQGNINRALSSSRRALAIDGDNGYANAVRGDVLYRWLMAKLNREKPGVELEKMPFNFREFIKDIIVEQHYNKAKNDPQWRDYANGQITYLSQFFAQPQDRFMAAPEDRVKIEVPPTL